MGDDADSLEYLAHVPLFSLCTKDELDSLSGRTMPATVDESQVLILEGQGAYEFFVVVSGRAKVTREGRMVAEIGPGDFFGELALLDQSLRDASVTALTSMEIIVMTAWDFEEALVEAPHMTRRLMAGMARRLRQHIFSAT